MTALVRRESVLDRRSLVVVAALALVVLALVVLSVGTGDYEMSPGEVLATLAGQGTKAQYLVVMGRLPRALVAILVGTALALAGAVFQTITRNPLGSPDVIGFTTGSATGGIVGLLLIGSGPGVVSLGALAGGLLTALVVMALCAPHGLLSSRLVLLGIAVSAVLVGVNSYLLVKANLEAASQAVGWLVGDLAGRDWSYFVPLAVAVAVFAPIVFVNGRALRMLEMGDDTATGIGVDVRRVRLTLVLVAVALVAAATAATGPLPFIALAAPQLARRMTRLPGPNLAASAFVGAALVVAADYLGQRLLESSLLPAGVVAAALGGAYLLWLLLRRRA
ncbi:iron chelate uptake ABC transporter family permease subunit [Amycolatopsis sp. EV170708-02-1]|uniref:FecCD family ABC transporter permease n=1 Tax=Amycolatopsis sp. EV170708-02-1 TaxID=2919322 RepID=UPI001F0C3689|nr:iron chelate uptake ABC transporter family permease subunit [Amycolatopsis sp. EV170708-02-1]UMP02974.1 iron chelate uptake ABC transporter family permease subunit [Amycolatopsis sp. EV170708-02-1]